MINPGTVFTREAAERIIRATRLVENMAGIESRPMRRRGRGDRPNVVRVLNESGLTVPQYGVVMLTDWSTVHSYYNVDRPNATGLTEIAIATGEIAVGAEGWAWIEGVQKVLASSYAGLSFGDAMGTQVDSFYLAADTLGVMRMMGNIPVGDQPGGLEANGGIVRGEPIVGTGADFDCEACRMNETLGLTVECRTNDPDSPETGQVWYRTDL